MDLPVVAVVGRPNVGKSTLVNRIVGRRAAIVEERPGVTRDRKELVAEWTGHTFRVVDTGGWLAPGDAGLTGEESGLAEKVSAQAAAAVKEADVVCFVVDVTTGITEEDARVARLLQKAEPPVIVVANKVDDDRRESDLWEFARLGLGEPVPVSAMHGRLAGELLDSIVAALPDRPRDKPEDDESAVFSIARKWRTLMPLSPTSCNSSRRCSPRGSLRTMGLHNHPFPQRGPLDEPPS